MHACIHKLYKAYINFQTNKKAIVEDAVAAVEVAKVVPDVPAVAAAVEVCIIFYNCAYYK